MRLLRRDLRPIQVVKFKGITELTDSEGYFIGGKIAKYELPIETLAHVSNNKGNVEVELFGLELKYDVVVLLNDTSINPTENDLIFIDLTPSYTGEAILKAEYKTIRIAKTSKVKAVALEKVK